MLDNITNFFQDGESLAFILMALFAICGAVLMISFTKVVHMVIALALTFISLGGLYVLLEAEFVAFVQVLIYAGAVTILMIFGIMMTKHRPEEDETQEQKPWYQALLLIGPLALFGLLFFAIQRANFLPEPFDAGEDNTKAIGEALYTQHVIPFELVSLLLTVAFIGAIILAKREEE